MGDAEVGHRFMGQQSEVWRETHADPATSYMSTTIPTKRHSVGMPEMSQPSAYQHELLDTFPTTTQVIDAQYLT